MVDSQIILWLLALCVSIANVCQGLTVKSPNMRSTSTSNINPGHGRIEILQVPDLLCDFETSCPWTFSNYSGKGDWLIMSPQQLWPHIHIPQPSTDYSKGTSDGHFLLLLLHGSTSGICEFSLTSPVVVTSKPGCHLQLAFYHPEAGKGNLSVQIRAADSNVITDSPPLQNKKLGVRGQWELLTAHIGEVPTPFRITLLYSACGCESLSIVGLDSISLVDCTQDGRHPWPGEDGCTTDNSFLCEVGTCINKKRLCDFHNDCPLGEDEGALCDALPPGSSCSFESGKCGWTVLGEQHSWIIVTSEDLSKNEELLGSALKVTQGHFLFLQLRNKHMEGSASVSSLTLPPPSSSEDCLVHFLLYLFGVYNGTISLLIQDSDIQEGPLLVWQQAGSWKNNWVEITVHLRDILHSFHLILNATWGTGSRADLAVDNIVFGVSCFDLGNRSPSLSNKLLRDTESASDLGFTGLPHEPLMSDDSGMTWLFTSCGASGPRGPTPAQCNSSYQNKNLNVTVGKEGSLRGVQMWHVPATNKYIISAYGAAGGKGAKNHNMRSHGIIVSAVFQLKKGDILYILVGQQGEDACPGKDLLTQQICLGESSVIEDEFSDRTLNLGWAGGGGGGGGATYVFRMESGTLVPLLIAAGGGGKAYREDAKKSLADSPLEQYVNSTAIPGTNGRTGAAGGGGGGGGGGGWSDITKHSQAGKSLLEGAEGGSPCPQALSKLQWTTFGGFGGGGGACTAGGGGGGYRGGDAAETDDLTVDGQDGISFVNPLGEIFLQPLAAMESHGEVEIKVLLNCSHCQSESCKRDKETKNIICLCDDGEILASDNITCTAPRGPAPEGHLSFPLILAVVASTVLTGIVLACASLTLIYYRKKSQLEAVRMRLQSPEYKLSKIRTSIIMTDYNPNYCFAGKPTSLGDLKEVPRRNISLLRALGHGAFGEVYEGRVLGIPGESGPLQVAIKTLPAICSEQDEMDFLMEALIMSKFNHQNIVRCIGVSLQTLPRFILLELMTGGDMKSFLRQNRPRLTQKSSLCMLDLLHMARDIACGCKYLEENHFIHRDIAARNCLLTCAGSGRVAKIGDFGMARDIYRASYYRKGGRAMLPVKWMPPEAFLEGVFTSKTDTWSFGVLLWEIFSLGYMPYPCKTNQEVLEFVTSGGRMDPPKGCPGPVYRIMTQCWQHCPEHRPNFSTILERIDYCTQDPDVIHTLLPLECSPAVEEEGGTVMRPDISGGAVPMLVTSALTSEPDLHPNGQHTQAFKQKINLQCPLQKPQELSVQSESLRWTVPKATNRGSPGAWLCSDQDSATHSNSTNPRLKNKTKNLWNPTYGSWVLESFTRKSTQQQQLPFQHSGNTSNTTTTEKEDSGFEGNGSSSTSSSRASPSSPRACHPQSSSMMLRGAAKGATVGMDLVKLQSFPCGNVNYAYEDQNYETESLPLIMKALGEPRSQMVGSTGSPSLASEQDSQLVNKAEKPPRDRDSGFSLSEDLSVTPV
ncbi:leukocyte tyrosine kinase receptor isoform X1 [Polypterus senegalus]|uniref:leukocyte tyrosine kinase receptor isoform X1 n=1 Tax=Polypterus senegalus TaxID=55291 RepID=UPI0019630070|nr:leukocyte tyrosine kinase receptor isoform X1 [Polypterus senegalus]